MEAKEIIKMGLYNVAVEMMDDEIRERLHMEMAPCTAEEFLEAYMKAHKEKFGADFEI
jgi:hypothetical protein